MRIIVLTENTPASPEFRAEHGLSLYIETNRHKILFDAGQTDQFAENADRLDVDLSLVDVAFLSHGHYDHSGGLTRFLSLNRRAPVYANRRVFSDCWHGEDHYIGVDRALQANDRIRLTGDSLRIDDQLSLFACNDRPRPFPVAGANLTVRQPDGCFLPDEFLHEQYLLIEENERRVLVSGCSHKGVLNILSWFDPDVFVGGFHFMKTDPCAQRDELLSAAAALIRYRATYYTGHCTGIEQFDVLKQRMGDRLNALHAGSEIIL